MDKDVKELVTVIQKHDMECDAIPVSTCNQDCDGCLARDILKAGYILPSSEMKLIGDEEIMQGYCESCNLTRVRCDELGGVEGCVNYQASLNDYKTKIQAQLLDCKKAHASILAEKVREIFKQLESKFGWYTGKTMKTSNKLEKIIIDDTAQEGSLKEYETLKAKYGG